MGDSQGSASTDETRGRWVTSALEAFESAVLSPDITDLDKVIMKGQLSRVKQGVSVSFPDSDGKDIKVIRSSRLKLLGYRWNAGDRSWSKPKLT